MSNVDKTLTQNLDRIFKLADIEDWCADNHPAMIESIRSCEHDHLRIKIYIASECKGSVPLDYFELLLRGISYDVWRIAKVKCKLSQVHNYVCLWHIRIFRAVLDEH